MNKAMKMTAITVIAIIGILLIYRTLFVRTVKHNIGGLDNSETTAARFRWELFEGWVKSRPQYKGWESNPEIFKKANVEFRQTVKTNVEVLK